MKTLAFSIALVIMALGLFGGLVPSAFIWIAQHVVTSGAFYVIATIRVAFGLVLISAAAGSRAPKTLRVMGWVILLAGIITALMGLLAMDGARSMVEWMLQRELVVLRLMGVLVLSIGGFIAYACAPTSKHPPRIEGR